jgi:RHS repeat-associated protein
MSPRLPLAPASVRKCGPADYRRGLACRLLSCAATLLGGGLLAPHNPLAAPGEVQNLVFQSRQTVSWNASSGAEGYHLYRGMVSGLPSGNYGTCLLGSVQGATASDPDSPPVGAAFTYLVAGFDASGQGSLGTTSSGSPRSVAIACIPARRFFDVTSNGPAADGVVDGQEQLINPSALLFSSHRETTGVYLHTGEFFVSAVDMEMQGVGPSGNENTEEAPPRVVGAQLDFHGQRAAPDICTNCHGGLYSPRMHRSSHGGFLPANEQVMLGPYEPAYQVARCYRSQILYDGPLGQGWDSPAYARLEPSGNDVAYFPGMGRRELQVRADATHFFPRVGRYTSLRQNADGSFFFRDRDGTIQRFHALDGSNKAGAIESVEDRYGNRTAFLYDTQGLMTTVVDSLGRSVLYAYNADGRLASVTDFAGRSVVYTYDTGGNLVAARSPIVVGTPNGNDFPGGKTTTYTYSAGFAEERLNHNLLSIIAPNESSSLLPYIENSYDTNPASFQMDRVVGQAIGGINASGVPAGGSLTYAYGALNPGAIPSDPTIPRRMATVTDRNGNLREYIHNFLGNLLSVTRLTNRNLRPGEADYLTRFSYNLDGQILEILYPQGNSALFSYDAGTDRYRAGNLRELRLRADPVSLGGRGDGHGAETNDRVWTYSYDPVFNQILSITDPRGNDPAYVPPNGGTWSPARYTRSRFFDFQEGDPALNGINAYAAQHEIVLGTLPFGLGDLNGDGSASQILGNPVRVSDPSVLLASGSNQAAIEGDASQDIVTLFRYNAHGQPAAEIDAEGNRHDYEYFPQTDPDGDGSSTPTPADGRVLDPATGGFLRTRTIDTVATPGRNNGTNPAPAMIREDFVYDPVGNRTDLIDGRGVRTRWVVNSLDQVVELRRAAATADASGPSGDPSTGRGETGLTPFSFLVRYAYDANDNVRSVQLEDRGVTRGILPYIERSFTYDLLDDPVEAQQQATSSTTLVTQLRYDANQNRIRLTEPAGNGHELAYDERDLLLARVRGATGLRGGTPSVEGFDYDPNGNLSQSMDGRGGLTDYLYDGFDRLARRVDEVGGTCDFTYDPGGAESPTSLLVRGPSGGAPPADRSGASNVDLARLEIDLDEMGRAVRMDQGLFVPSGVSPARPPLLLEGPLLPADGRVNTVLEYDRLSRRTFESRDTGATVRLDYDGAGRALKKTLPGGNLVEWTYDGDQNVIEIAETEVSSSPGPPPEAFLTTYFYDAASRLTTLVDSVGQTSRYLYDSLDAVTTATDPRGPVSGSIARRSPGHTSITVPINSHGNVTRYTYDGADRPLTTVRLLTATGEGNGTTTPPPDTSNPQNPDGLITLTSVWDSNSLLSQERDDKGNDTTYAYDNLGRPIKITADDGTLEQRSYDAADNLTVRTEANGTVATHTYDAGQRLVATSVAPVPGIEGTTQRTFEYDGLSRLTRATDNNVATDSTDDVTVRFLYDSLGRLFEEWQQISDGTPARTTDVRWLADALPTDRIYPTGRQIHYSYDAADRLALVSDSSRPETVGYQYFGLQRVHTRTSNNGIRATRLSNTGTSDIGFDGARRTVLLRHLDPSSALLAGFEYRYDRAGNPTSQRRLHHAGSPPNFKGERYTLDSADRLVTFQEGFMDALHNLTSPALDSQSWTLDGAGGWPLMNKAGQGFLATPNNNNEYDEMQSGGTRIDDGVRDDVFDSATTPTIPDGFNLTHDKNGSETNIGLYNLRYDFENRPVRAFRNSDSLLMAQYTYDALGRRVKRQALVPGPTGPVPEIRRYYYLLADLVEERDGSDLLVRQASFGLEGLPLWQIKGDGSAQMILGDDGGSAIALATATLPASVLERVTYDPYGKPTFESALNVPLTPTGPFLPTSPNGNPTLFRGMRYDAELGARTNGLSSDLGGLYQTRFRYYDPNKGRFTTRDPLGMFGDLGNAGNGYAYAGSNPIRWSDTTGLSLDAYAKFGDVQGETEDRPQRMSTQVYSPRPRPKPVPGSLLEFLGGAPPTADANRARSGIPEVPSFNPFLMPVGGHAPGTKELIYVRTARNPLARPDSLLPPPEQVPSAPTIFSTFMASGGHAPGTKEHYRMSGTATQSAPVARNPLPPPSWLLLPYWTMTRPLYPTMGGQAVGIKD